nr:helix-turn-helix domain-containing protein [Rhodococcus sp. (in: high G+C Gram-positive bacteria)]
MTQPAVPLAMGLKDAADYVSLSERYLSNEIRAMRLPVRRFGKKISIKTEDLIEWYNAHAQGPK